MVARAAPEHRHPEEQAGIPQEREAPAAHETDDEAIGEAHDGAGRGHRVAREVLAEQAQDGRSEEHTSELQSLAYLVCRLLLEKKKKKTLNKLHIHEMQET